MRACLACFQFVVFTKVIDKKTLNTIFIAIASFFSTAVPLLLALLPDAPSAGGTGISSCDLTAGQASVIRSAARLALGIANVTGSAGECTYNVSLGSILRDD